MSEELYNSSDYCSLAEQYEELKKENAELLADKLHLIGAAMDGGDKYHYAAHDIGYRDMERKVKALEADYVISNRELLILQSRIAELEAENAELKAVIDQLIEVGNEITLVARDIYELDYESGEFTPIAEKWQALVKKRKEV